MFGIDGAVFAGDGTQNAIDERLLAHLLEIGDAQFFGLALQFEHRETAQFLPFGLGRGDLFGVRRRQLDGFVEEIVLREVPVVAVLELVELIEPVVLIVLVVLILVVLILIVLILVVETVLVVAVVVRVALIVPVVILVVLIVAELGLVALLVLGRGGIGAIGRGGGLNRFSGSGICGAGGGACRNIGRSGFFGLFTRGRLSGGGSFLCFFDFGIGLFLGRASALLFRSGVFCSFGFDYNFIFGVCGLLCSRHCDILFMLYLIFITNFFVKIFGGK